MTTRTPRPPQQPARRRGGFARVGQGLRRFERYMQSRPGVDYLMIRVLVLLLSSIGVVMVFSSSMTTSIAAGGTAWGAAARQGAMIVVGFVAFWVALKIKPGWIRKLAPWLLVVTLTMLVLVLTPMGTGREEVGSQSWLVLGPVQLQPSELAKVTIAIWGAAILAGRSDRGYRLRNPFVVFSVIAIAMAVLIFVQGDVGMAANFALTVVLILLIAGVKVQWVISAVVVGVIGLVVVLVGGGFRAARFEVFFNALFGNFEETQGQAFQSYQGFLSLADGSLFGVGLGQSRAKWFYLPEAQNDFIFAIIGEELGLWGGALVIVLFGALGYFGIRTAMRAQDQFQSLMAAALTVGVVSQAFINIGYVVGLLPMTGIQLPMISAGGTSAILTLASMGVLASIARHEPEAVSAMQSYGRPLFDRLLFIREPQSEEDRAGAARTPTKPDRFGAPVTHRRAAPERGGSVTTRQSRPAPRPGRQQERYRSQRGRRH